MKKRKKKALNGKTLKDLLKEVYLLKPEDNFKMYGGGYFTTEHLTIDASYPDMIYIRPDWYLSYVKNLAWLLSIRFNLDCNKLDISIFEKMVKFISKNQCSMKGIIDYEIAKIRNQKEFYIPLFYSSPSRILASSDALFNTDYLGSAEEAKKNTINYLTENNVITTSEKVKGNLKISFKSASFFYNTKAFKIKY